VNYQREREEFIARVVAAGLSFETTVKILRGAATHQRCSEMSCDNEYYCNVVERNCARCTDHAVDPPKGKVSTCPAHRAEDRMTKALAGTEWQVGFQGDPRGYTVRLWAPGTTPNPDSSSGYYGVPAR
jgi:hypothetical protein